MIDEDPDEETCFEFVDDDTHPVSRFIFSCLKLNVLC